MEIDPDIRRASAHESRALSDLAYRSKAYWGYSNEFMEACRGELTYTADNLINLPFHVLHENDRLIGFYGLGKVSESAVELEALFVDPSLIGRGYGHRLLQHARTIARQSGATEMIIQSDPNCSSFYEKAGGRLIGERESDSIPGRVLPVLVIPLTDVAEKEPRSLFETWLDRYHQCFHDRELERLESMYVPDGQVVYFDNHRDCDSSDLTDHLKKVRRFFDTGSIVDLIVDELIVHEYSDSAVLLTKVRYCDQLEHGVRVSFFLEKHQDDWKIRHLHYSFDPNEP